MTRTLNIAGMCCAAWFVIISINAGIYMISETAAAVLYLASLAVMLIWGTASVVIWIYKKTHGAPARNEDKLVFESVTEIDNDAQSK